MYLFFTRSVLLYVLFKMKTSRSDMKSPCWLLKNLLHILMALKAITSESDAPLPLPLSPEGGGDFGRRPFINKKRAKKDGRIINKESQLSALLTCIHTEKSY